MIETELKELPSGWAWTTFGEVTEPEVDQGGPNNEMEFTYIDIGGIDNRAKVIAQRKVLPVTRAPSRARQRLDPGDVLVTRRLEDEDLERFILRRERGDSDP